MLVQISNWFDRNTYVEQDLGRKTLYQRVAVLINSPGTSENPIAVDMVYKWKHGVDMTTEFEAGVFTQFCNRL